MKYYVYVWFLVDSGKVFYIGKGTHNRVLSMKDRNKHFKSMRTKCKCDYKILKYFNDEDEAYNYELKKGLEYKAKGEAWCSYILGKSNCFVSKEVKNKISKTLKNKKNVRKGFNLSEETKAKISKAHKGRVQTEITKQRRSTSLKGHIVTEETKAKISKSKKGYKNPMYGKKRTKEALANSKRVIKIDVTTNKQLKTYVSVSEASRQHNIRVSDIARVCRGERNTAGGFKWVYADKVIPS